MFKIITDKNLNNNEKERIHKTYSEILGVKSEIIAYNVDDFNSIEFDFLSSCGNDSIFGLYLSTEELSVNKEDVILGIGLNSDICEINQKDQIELCKRYLLLIRKAIQLYEQVSVKNEKRVHLFISLEGLSLSKITEEISVTEKHFFNISGYVFPQDVQGQLSFFLNCLSKKWSKQSNLKYRNDLKNQSWNHYAIFPIDLLYNITMQYALSRNVDEYGSNNGEVEISKKLEKKYRGVVSFYFLKTTKFIIICDLRIVIANTYEYLSAILELRKSNIISEKRFIELINVELINYISNPYFANESLALSENKQLCKGIAASNYMAVGKIITDDSFLYDSPNILVKEELLPSDMNKIKKVVGVVTKLNSVTSHPAVIMRQMGKAFVCACSDLQIFNNSIVFGSRELKAGTYISVNGVTGNIYEGKLDLVKTDDLPHKGEVVKIFKSTSKVNVLCNTEDTQLLNEAINNGASGIGLFRTEYMLDEDSKQWLKDSLIYNDNNFNKESLEQLKSFSQEKFIQILAEIKEGICHIRSFDFPLHELFDNELEKEKYKNIFEFNPMLGNRGCRLSIIFSEIFIMQLQALLDAYVVSGKKAKLGIMLPMVADVNEILFLKNLIFDTISSNENYSGIVLDIGSMIETPRAMFTINEIAKHVDFLSIGTNDLTQMSWGISRDDSHFYLPEYLSKKIIRDNPFIKFDRDGMYDVLFEAINRARKANFKVKIGFCGEQANDRESLEMFLSMDIDFVSVSPKKVLQTLYFCSKDF